MSNKLTSLINEKIGIKWTIFEKNIIISSMKNLALSLVGFFIFNTQISAMTLSQNDVSILIPLPAIKELNLLLQPNSVGKFGALLPSSIFEKLPDLNPFANNDRTYSALRVVSVRIDPCFPIAPSLLGCQPQIRFIWQPLLFTTEQKITAFDATVHTFYNLDKNEFNLLIKDLEQLKKNSGFKSTDEALSVNPILLKKGLNSLYTKNLFKILLSFSGEQKISRVTFMQVSASANIWTFGGFDLVNGVMQDLQIPRINSKLQTFTNIVLEVPTFFKGDLYPAPAGPDTINLLVRDSSVIAPSDKDEIIESTLSAVRIENPIKHSPQTIDCVSCHTAQSAKIWAIKQYPWLTLDLRSTDLKFNSKYNLKNTSPQPEKTTSLRSFGYEGSVPAISQRVINETAKVLETLKK